MRLKKILLILYLLVFSYIQCIADHTQRVLFISSYNSSFPTYFSQIKGIKSVLDTSNILLDIESLDTKRFGNSDNIILINKLIKFKVSQGVEYDAIITSDDNAFNYALRNQNTIFQNIPIVFLGLNNLKQAIAQNQNPMTTGVLERVSIQETVQLMLNLFPDTKKAYVISDSTYTGIADLNQFRTLNLNNDITFYEIFLGKLSFDEFTSELKKIDKNAPTLLLSAYLDKNHRTIEFSETLKLIKMNMDAPVFHLWYHGIGNGILGGKVISHIEQGKEAAKMVYQILNGTPASSIKVKTESPNKYVFDYKELKKHNISFSEIPKGSTIIGKKTNIYERNKNEIFTGLIFFIIQSILIFYLLITMKRRLKIEENLKLKINEYHALNEEYLSLNEDYQNTNEKLRDANIDLTEAKEKLRKNMEELDVKNKDLMLIEDELRVYNAKLNKKNIELAESEQKYRSLFNNLSEAFALYEIITDKNEKSINYYIRDVNPLFLKMVKYKYEEIINKQVSENSPFYAEHLLMEFRSIATYGGSKKLIDYIPTLDKYFEMHIFSPKKYFFAIIYGDITEGVRAKEALLEEKNRNDFILKGTNAGTWDWNLITSELIINDKWAELIGYSIKELEPVKDDTAFDLMHPEDKVLVKNVLKKVFTKQLHYYDIEFRLKHKAGHWVWIHSRGNIVEWGSDSKPLRMTGTHMDISARKKTELALIESEKRFKTIFDKSKTVMIMLDPSTGAIVDANNSAANYYGYTKEELLTMKIDRINILKMDIIKNEMKNAVSEKKNFFRFQHLIKSGDIRDVEVFASPITVNNQKFLHSIIIDVTKSVEAEYQIQQVNRRFQGLENIIHHEADSINDLLDFTLKQCIEFTDSDLGAVYHYNREKEIFYLNNWSQDISLTYSANIINENIENMDCLNKAVNLERAVILNNPTNPYPFQKISKFKGELLKSLTIPIISDGEVAALFWLASKTNLYSKFHAEQLLLLLDTAWILVEKQRLQDQKY